MPPPAALTALAREQRHEAAGLHALARDETEAERLAAAADALERRVVDLTAQAQRLQAHLDAAPRSQGRAGVGPRPEQRCRRGAARGRRGA